MLPADKGKMSRGDATDRPSDAIDLQHCPRSPMSQQATVTTSDAILRTNQECDDRLETTGDIDRCQ